LTPDIVTNPVEPVVPDIDARMNVIRDIRLHARSRATEKKSKVHFPLVEAATANPSMISYHTLLVDEASMRTLDVILKFAVVLVVLAIFAWMARIGRRGRPK
jgi:hypothetical protein